jgi:hypothetical protein
MEDRGCHRIGISQNQPHINADVAPQKYSGEHGISHTNLYVIKKNYLVLALWSL